MTTVALVGSEGLGPALSHLLVQNQHDVLWWEPEGLDSTLELDKHDHIRRVECSALADVPIIITCVPLGVLRTIGQQLGQYLSGRHIVVHCARTIEAKTFATGSTILKEVTPTHRFGFLTGPVHTEDVTKGLFGAGLVASAFPEIHDIFEQLLVSPRFRLYRNKDLLGAELAASYTRVLSFVMGVAAGMQQGPSILSTVFARGLAEMSKFVGAMGGQAQTVFGLSGTGTLFAELQEPGSIDFQLGKLVSQKGVFDRREAQLALGPSVDEFYTLLKTFRELLTQRNLSAHIFSGAYDMIVNGLSTKEAALSLMALPVLED